MKISVALATYNGEDFLAEQLQSFGTQTRRPDEIIISDDNSTDGTLQLIEKFQLETDILIKVVKNKSGQGVAKNFSNALDNTSGDLILLSDQDDIWIANKVEIYETYFMNNPHVQLILSDALIFQGAFKSENRTKLDYFKERSFNFDSFCTGCCMGFRRSFMEVSLPIPSEGYAHDVWLNDVALALGSREVLDLTTMYYRRHFKNHSDHISSNIFRLGCYDEFLALTKENKNRDRKKSHVIHSAILLDHFTRLRKAKPELTYDFDSIVEKIYTQNKFDLQREKIANQTFLVRLWMSLRFLLNGGYRNYNGIRSVVKDIFFP